MASNFLLVIRLFNLFRDPIDRQTVNGAFAMTQINKKKNEKNSRLLALSLPSIRMRLVAMKVSLEITIYARVSMCDKHLIADKTTIILTVILNDNHYTNSAALASSLVAFNSTSEREKNICLCFLISCV